MMTINSNIERVAKEMRLLAKPEKMARIASTALTRSAKVARDAVKREMTTAFDRPTPFTLKAVDYEAATAKTLQARVYVREENSYGTQPVKYLAPEVYGGKRRQKRFELALQSTGLLPRGMYAVPGAAAKVDAYGNWSKGQIVQVLAYLRAFGEQGYKSNMSDKNRARFTKRTQVGYFVGSPGGGKAPRGIWEFRRFAAGSSVKPIAIFIKAPTYRKRYMFSETADRVAQVELPKQIKIAIDQSIARMRA